MKLFFKELFYILRDTSKIKLCLLTLCVTFTAIFELVSVAFVLPFISLVADPSIIETNYYFRIAYHKLGFVSTQPFIIFLGITFFSLIIFGNIFAALTNWYVTRFSYVEGHKIATKLLRRYMAMPYAFFFQRNTRELSKVIAFDVYRVTSGIMVPAIQVVSKTMIVVSLLALLLYAHPTLAVMIAGILGGAYILAFVFIKKLLAKAGAKSSDANARQNVAMGEALVGIKEIKILAKEEFFLEKFSKNCLEFSLSESVNTSAPFVVRYMLEIVAIGSILFAAAFLYKQTNSILEMLPLLSLYAFAGYRLLPAMQQIFSGITTSKYFRVCVSKVYHELRQIPNIGTPYKLTNMPFKNKIELRNVCYRYPSSDRDAISHITLEIAKNKTIGLVGYTGSGKSSLADVLLGLLTPTQGGFFIDGLEITAKNVKEWQRRIGYVPQKIFLLDDTIEKNIAFGIPEEEIDQAQLQHVAKLADLFDFICKDTPLQFKTMVGENGICLSGGQRQRIGIARALYHNPSVLIFDEATSALDSVTEHTIWKAINALMGKKTIIIIAHRMSTVKACDDIFMLDKGKLVEQGQYEQLLNVSTRFKTMVESAVS